MNIRTTIGLAIAAIILVSAYLMWGRSREIPLETIPLTPAETAAPPSKPAAEPADQPADQPSTAVPPAAVLDDRRLAAELFRDGRIIAQVVHQRRGQRQMMFERDGQPEGSGWMMIEPTRCLARGYLIDDIILVLQRLEYLSKFDLQSPQSVTLEQAGIQPEPEARLALTTTEGRTMEVQVGHLLVGQNKRYVYLPDRPKTLFVADEDFQNLLQQKPTDFRERKFFDLDPAAAVELEVTEARPDQPVTYRLRKLGKQWMFVEPFAARGETRTIDQVIAALGRLWARRWLEEPPARLRDFGLEAPYLRLRVVTETVDAAAAEDDPSRYTPRESVLLISDRSPVDDHQQVYAKRDGEEQVGTINASELEAFDPDLRRWRDMSLLPDVLQAAAVTIRRPDATLSFHRTDGRWVFAESGQAAEPDELDALLQTLSDLKAVSFVEQEIPQAFGLNPPAAEIRLEFPEGQDQILRIGDYSEHVERWLRYVQHVGTPGVAKVRSRQVARAFASPRTFHNREILDVEPQRLIKIELTRRLASSTPVQFLTLTRDDAKIWQMTTPTQAAVKLKPVRELVDRLARFRGTAIVGELDPNPLGLVTPDIQLSVTVEGIPTVQAGAVQAGMEAAAPFVRRINLSRREDRVFVHRLDVPDFMEVDPAIYEALQAEFLDGRFWTFEPSQVVAFGSAQAGRTARFALDSRGHWHYTIEPDIPIDSGKVEAHIRALCDQETPRFVEYNATHLNGYGLQGAVRQFFFEMQDGVRHELQVSDVPFPGGTDPRYYARVAGTSRVFIVGPGLIDLATIQLERFAAAEE